MRKKWPRKTIRRQAAWRRPSCGRNRRDECRGRRRSGWRGETAGGHSGKRQLIFEHLKVAGGRRAGRVDGVRDGRRAWGRVGRTTAGDLVHLEAASRFSGIFRQLVPQKGGARCLKAHGIRSLPGSARNPDAAGSPWYEAVPGTGALRRGTGTFSRTPGTRSRRRARKPPGRPPAGTTHPPPLTGRAPGRLSEKCLSPF